MIFNHLKVGLRNASQKKFYSLLNVTGLAGIYTLISVTITLTAVYLFMPSFNQLAEKEFTLQSVMSTPILGSLALVFIIIVLLAGSYPAFYLTSFKPVSVFRGNSLIGGKSKQLRRSLIVFQFITSLTLVICTVVVLEQLNYLKNKNIGFDKENIFIVQSTYRLGNNYQAFL